MKCIDVFVCQVWHENENENENETPLLNILHYDILWCNILYSAAYNHMFSA